MLANRLLYEENICFEYGEYSMEYLSIPQKTVMDMNNVMCPENRMYRGSKSR